MTIIMSKAPKTGLSYYHPLFTGEGYTISIDSIVFDTYLRSVRDCQRLMALIANQSYYDANTANWQSFKIGTYKEQFRIEMKDGSSFWLGVGLNQKVFEQCRVRVDFNPNKVAKHHATKEIFMFIVCNSMEMHRQIRRFDLAIDIPVERLDCFLVKDNRAYMERKRGAEWTQYLGAKSSHVGRVKLYNKTVESKLSYPLTRLELTLAPQKSYDSVSFPDVYVLDSLQVPIEEIRITDTERFILNALLQGCGSPKDLGRKTRAKIELLMENYVHKVKISETDYQLIIDQLEVYRTTGTL